LKQIEGDICKLIYSIIRTSSRNFMLQVAGRRREGERKIDERARKERG
jgi:hypothetical protein